VHAAWHIHGGAGGAYVGGAPSANDRPWKLQKGGADRGTVDGHGEGATCFDIDGALQTCAALHCDGRPGVHVMAEVFGGMRIWRSARSTCAGILAGRYRGSCPICRSARPSALYELKGTRYGSQPHQLHAMVRR
jgi:hypothetical protein